MAPVWRDRKLFISFILVAILSGGGAVVTGLIGQTTAAWGLFALAAAAVLPAVAPMILDYFHERQQARENLEKVEELRPDLTGGSPSDLLNPHRAVVPFARRDIELARLLEWCENGARRSLRLVIGAGGTGKTRLALSLTDELTARNWRCVWVDAEQETNVVAAVRDVTPGQVLLVVDYAETRTGLAKLLRDAAADSGTAIRVLLIARQSDDWWAQLQATPPAVRVLVADADQHQEQLSTMVHEQATALYLIRQAIPYFAARLGARQLDPAHVRIEGWSADGYRILDLHAAALVAVLSTPNRWPGRGVRIDMRAVLETLLGHEKRYWRGRAQTMGLLGGPLGLTMEQMSQTVAVVSLLGAASEAEAIQLLRRVPGTKPSRALAAWLTSLYPPGADDESIGSLRPDRLAELHVVNELEKNPELADNWLADLDIEQVRRALILLGRASAEYPAGQPLLQLAFSRFSQMVEHMDLSADIVMAIMMTIPVGTVSLDIYTKIVKRILAALPTGAKERAILLFQYSNALSAAGRKEEALAAVEESAAVMRTLANDRPGSDPFVLPAPLMNQANLLRDLGRVEEALAVNDEAITLWRTLAADHPDGYLPSMAGALVNQSNFLSSLGRWDEAVRPCEESINLLRDLSGAHPEEFLARLADALESYSFCLSRLKRREEALAAIEESVAVWRSVSGSWDAGYSPGFAWALESLAYCLPAFNRREEALAAIEESVTVWRSLAEDGLTQHKAGLAQALEAFSSQLSGFHRREEALAAIEESVTVWRALANDAPVEYRARLASALGNLSGALRELGRDVDAEAADAERQTIRDGR